MDLDLSLAASFLVLAEERHYGHLRSPACT